MLVGRLCRGAAVCVVTVLVLITGTAGVASAEHGFKPIFNGENLEGWDGNPKFWRVEDGAITGQTTVENPTKGNTFIIWRQGELDDFELKLQYRIIGGNSGIQYRSVENEKEWGRWVIGGYQADFESGATYSGILYGERDRGILAKRGEQTVIRANHKPEVIGSVGDPKEIQAAIRHEEWNDYHIVVRGYHFVHRINGHVTVDVTDEDLSGRRRAGLLALQLHAGPAMRVQFRKIRLKRLPMATQKKIVLVAGTRSHGYGSHEFNAGCRLLQHCLDQNIPSVHTALYLNGWPQDPTAFDNANAIVLYMNGGEKHPIRSHLFEIDAIMSRGVGLACMHYAVEVPAGASGYYFQKWLGGFFEPYWSVNPHWTLPDPQLAQDHAITRGVKPMAINDEWYFHMRFPQGQGPEDIQGTTPILWATPPDKLRLGKHGIRSGNEYVAKRKGEPEVLGWALERPDGGRGFGFTGGHYHRNWANDDFRKLILNAVVWVAGAEVPADGVPSRTPTVSEIEVHQDYPKP